MTTRTVAGLALFVLGPPALLFVAVDYVASYSAPRSSIPDRPLQAEYLEFDPLQMWRLRAGYREGEVEIAAEGFRAPFPRVGDGEKLVFVVGGSTVFGVGQPSDKTITAYLQGLADRHRPDMRLRFVNAGVTAYYSTQELLHLQRHVLPHRPTMVIALTGRNDAFYGLHPDYSADEVPYHGVLRQQVGALDPYYDSLETRGHELHVMRWLRGRHRPEVFNWLRDFEQPHLQYHQAATEVFLRNAKSTHALLAGQNIAFYLFLQPTVRFPERVLTPEERAMVNDFYLPALDSAYAELARDASTALPPTWFRGFASISGAESPQIFIDNVHLTPAGAERVASHIFQSVFGPAGQQ